MAKSTNKTRSPSCQLEVPKAIEPLMQAFHVESEEAAHCLILEASRAIYGGNSSLMGFIEPSQKELKGISSLMRGISPTDSLETLYAAQIIASHMLGMRKLSSEYQEDQRLGLKLLRFSNDSMQQLEKKRGIRSQNITVNHNYIGQGNISQTIIKKDGE